MNRRYPVKLFLAIAVLAFGASAYSRSGSESKMEQTRKAERQERTSRSTSSTESRGGAMSDDMGYGDMGYGGMGY